MTVESPAGSRGPVPGRTPPLTAVAAIAVAGVAYSAWFLQFFLNPALDAGNGYVSELSATDQPYHDLFAGIDLLSGALAAGVAGLLLLRVRPRGWALTGWSALALFGAFSIVDSLSAMDCAPNSDTTCALRERAGTVSVAHELHSVTSALVVVCGIVSLVALAVAARRRGGVIVRWSWPILVVETTTAVATLPLMYVGVFLGVMERIQVTVISLWLFVIAGELYAARRRAVTLGSSPSRSPHPIVRGSAPIR